MDFLRKKKAPPLLQPESNSSVYLFFRASSSRTHHSVFHARGGSGGGGGGEKAPAHARIKEREKKLWRREPRKKRARQREFPVTLVEPCSFEAPAGSISLFASYMDREREREKAQPPPLYFDCKLIISSAPAWGYSFFTTIFRIKVFLSRRLLLLLSLISKQYCQRLI